MARLLALRAPTSAEVCALCGCDGRGCDATFSQREKVAAERTDEGPRCSRLAQIRRPLAPHPAAPQPPSPSGTGAKRRALASLSAPGPARAFGPAAHRHFGAPDRHLVERVLAREAARRQAGRPAHPARPPSGLRRARPFRRASACAPGCARPSAATERPGGAGRRIGRRRGPPPRSAAPADRRRWRARSRAAA